MRDTDADADSGEGESGSSCEGCELMHVMQDSEVVQTDASVIIHTVSVSFSSEDSAAIFRAWIHLSGIKEFNAWVARQAAE